MGCCVSNAILDNKRSTEIHQQPSLSPIAITSTTNTPFSISPVSLPPQRSTPISPLSTTESSYRSPRIHPDDQPKSKEETLDLHRLNQTTLHAPSTPVHILVGTDSPLSASGSISTAKSHPPLVIPPPSLPPSGEIIHPPLIEVRNKYRPHEMLAFVRPLDPALFPRRRLHSFRNEMNLHVDTMSNATHHRRLTPKSFNHVHKKDWNQLYESTKYRVGMNEAIQLRERLRRLDQSPSSL